jgi:enediyne biosynthesis protein E4
MNQCRKLKCAVAAALLPVALATVAMGESASGPNAATTESREQPRARKLRFTDIALRPETGIDYRRRKSPRDSLADHIKMKPAVTFMDAFFYPTKPRGAPGVAVFDFDKDGDQDIYVTNGPGVANSLYVNQLKETGTVWFMDAAIAAGVGAEQQDSSGVCYGDIDNDDDDDLLVLGSCEAPKLFEYKGNGTFADISASSGIGTGAQCSTTCSMGDVDGNGLVDVVIGNSTTHWNDLTAVFSHNQLFVNKGHNRFVDDSKNSGLLNTYGPQFEGQKGINGLPNLTWSIAMVDYDLDGDVDIIEADDQTGDTSVDKGFIQIFQNDGAGKFTNVTAEALGLKTGGWMGFSFGDLNCDGRMDLFATNFGDYAGAAANRGKLASRWFLGAGHGKLLDPGVNPEVGASVFGWGTGMGDFDNDADYDIVYRGGEDFMFYIDATNPGTILRNQGCSAKFTVDKSLLRSNPLHRNVQGVALGDLDNNGKVDIVSVSSFDIPDNIPRVEPPAGDLGSPLDTATMVQQFAPVLPPAANPQDQQFVFNGYQFPDGTLSVELNHSENGNHSVSVRLVGTKGIIDAGVVNRDGIGAVAFFTPDRGATSMKPILGGASYASQDSLATIFGLGEAHKGTVDILWPGGTRNRLYGVRAGESIRFPEIPCSYAGKWRHLSDYAQCVDSALDELVRKHWLSKNMQHRLHESAIRAFAGREDDRNQ